MHTASEKASMARTVACFAALALTLSADWLFNWCAFPLFDGVWYWTREACSAAGGLAVTALAIVSYWRPQLFTSRFMIGVLIVTAVVGIPSCATGLALSQSAILVVGATAFTVTAGLSNIIVGIACVGLPARRLGICLIGAYTCAYLLRAPLIALPEQVNFALFCLVPLAAAAIALPYARPVFDQRYEEGTPAEVALTTPSSTLPFEHQFFLMLLLFRFIYGFTLTFGETDRTPLLAVGALVPLAIVLAIAVARKRAIAPEALFQTSILFSVAGFLFISIGTDETRVASVLLACGTGFFEIFMFFMLVELGTRNPVVALPVLAWGNTMASWGTLFGANFGRLTNSLSHSPEAASAAVALVVFSLVAYLVLAREGLDFSKMIQGLTPVAPLAAARTEGDAPLSISARCKGLASAHGLTAREAEILGYLARGRNVRFIEEELVVSYNTVKTHVSHIYTKLGVHSH